MHKAGWIFNLDSEASLKRYIRDGVYATKIKPPSKSAWATAYLGTLADYASMQAGEQIYFFIRRKIYGVGELINIPGTNACVFDNFENASLPKNYHDDYFNKSEDFYLKSLLYYEKDIWKERVDDNLERYFQQRWLCCFKPSPYFYEGIDMDDMLKSDTTYRGMRSLRTFYGLSFIKLPPDENAAFLEYIKTKKVQKLPIEENYSTNSYADNHKEISERYKPHNQLGLNTLVVYHQKLKPNTIQSEMLLEAYLLQQLTTQNEELEKTFGKWDYLSHQVAASPFKPVEYMSFIDICGYSGGNGFRQANKYLIIELKKETATKDSLEQVKKYIEWFKWEYHATDENIESFIVARDFDFKNTSSNTKLVKYIVKNDKVDFALVDN